MPFLFAEPGSRSQASLRFERATKPGEDLRATFPDRIATHSREQDFYFGRDGAIRPPR
jgi:hypothetical protein